MLHTDFDLLGHPIALPQTATEHPYKSRPISPETKRAKIARSFEQSKNLVLFDELLDYLKAPLLVGCQLPTEYQSDAGKVAVAEDDDEEISVTSEEIPFEAWGEGWITDRHGLLWSKEGLLFTQVRLFWRSMEELALSNNEQEKWSVLRWLFRPAIWKHYVYDKRIGRSHCLEVHERDDPFSFHNCCIAARMEGDAVREGVRRNIAAEIIKAVEKVCRFD